MPQHMSNKKLSNGCVGSVPLAAVIPADGEFERPPAVEHALLQLA